MAKQAKQENMPTAQDYRTPMQIAEVYIHWNGGCYYVCPRCHITMERDFVSYCDRCGQCLNWTNYRKAKPVYRMKGP